MFIIKLCPAGDVYIFDSEDGEILFSPYSGSEPTQVYRAACRQAGYSIQIDDPHKILEELENHEIEGNRYQIKDWLDQIEYAIKSWGGKNPIAGKEYSNGMVRPLDDRPLVLSKKTEQEPNTITKKQADATEQGGTL